MKGTTDDAKDCLDAAVSCLQSERYDEAVALYEYILESAPKNIDALVGAGCAYMLYGDVDMSIRYIGLALSYDQQVAKTWPKLFSWSYNRYAELCAHRGEYDSACDSYRTIRKYHPNDMHALSGLVNLYCQEGSFALAIACCDDAINANPAQLKARYIKAGVYIAQGCIQQAVGEYRDIVDLDKRQMKAYAYLGRCFYRLHQYKEAVIAYNNALACGAPRHAGVMIEKAMVLSAWRARAFSYLGQ